MNANHGLNLWRDTWNPVSDLRREFDRLFDDWAPSGRGVQTETAFTPACDVEEAEGHYLLTIEMAGVKKEDVKIEVVDNQIHISGERRSETKNGRDGRLYSERRFGKLSRSFMLPAGVDGGQVEANYQDGILRILLPKAESAKPRQIQITNGSTGSRFFSKFLGKPQEKEDMQSASNQRSQQVAS